LALKAVPKPKKRIRNRALSKAMREETPYCERCGNPAHGGPHHIKYQSQGGPVLLIVERWRNR